MMLELRNLYTELYQTGAYFMQYPNDTKLHLTVIPNPTLYNIYEFGVPEVRRQLLLHILGTEDLFRTLQMPEMLLYQLSVIQYRGKKSDSYLPTL
jgi:hypothetical protein